jgi:Uma2 family endonuclease
MDWSYTVKEYVQVEEESTIKHEYIEGTIRAMSGGSLAHARMQMSLGAILMRQLEGRRCNVFSSDGRVRVRGRSVITYPDLAVSCGKLEVDTEDPQAQLSPTVLVEVTSPSSERYDRGLKYSYYQGIGSLREYVIVSHREPLIEVFRPSGDGTWHLAERATTGGSVTLVSIECGIDVDEVYRDRQVAES